MRDNKDGMLDVARDEKQSVVKNNKQQRENELRSARHAQCEEKQKNISKSPTKEKQIEELLQQLKELTQSIDDKESKTKHVSNSDNEEYDKGQGNRSFLIWNIDGLQNKRQIFCKSNNKI